MQLEYRSKEPAFSARAIALLCAPIPALVVGVLVMQRSGVSKAIWMQQLAAGVVLLILCVVSRLIPYATSRSRPRAFLIVAGAALLLLGSTLLHGGGDGVHRWVSLGPLQLNAAFISLPLLLIALNGIASRESVDGRWIFVSIACAAAVILALQPDVSQATAFAVALLVMLVQRGRAHMSEWVACAVAIACAFIAWSRPGALEPVSYVEEIVALAATFGAGWLIAAALALLLVPLPFLSGSSRHDGKSAGWFLAAYYAVVCIAPFFGPYPVPIMGYGLSPLLGYFAALTSATRSTNVDLQTLR